MRREGYALTGPSVAIDPRHDAVRADLADVRLARHVFAPHYVMFAARTLARPAELRSASGADAAVICSVAPGTRFELLDVTGGTAWGIARPSGEVGYLPADALRASTEAPVAS